MAGATREARGGALTPREREVLTAVAHGNDTKTIAGRLFISPETVRAHVRNSMAKLSAHTRAQLVAIALSQGEICYWPKLPGTVCGNA